MDSLQRMHILPRNVSITISFLSARHLMRFIKWAIKQLPAKLRRSRNSVAMGSQGNIGNEEEAVSVAEKIGYPVIIKAAAGGGGRGMRIVRKPDEMEKMFLIARKEAEIAFNDPSVFIEKYIEDPKHIEFQILGDTRRET